MNSSIKRIKTFRVMKLYLYIIFLAYFFMDYITRRTKDERPVRLIFFHQSRVLEPLHHSLLTLDSSVSDTADLFTFENLPAFTVIALVKRNNVAIVDKVNESITSIAFVSKVNRKIKEVYFPRAMATFFEFGKKHTLRILVRDVTNH